MLYAQWLVLHRSQLMHFCVPASLWRELFQKLSGHVHDTDAWLQWDPHHPSGPAVVAAQGLSPDQSIWVVRHTNTAASGWQLLARLKDDFPACLAVADDIQALASDSGEDEDQLDELQDASPAAEGEAEEAGATGSMSAQERVFAAVRLVLHCHVFMFEAQGLGAEGTNLRVRYMMEPLMSRLPAAALAHIAVCPFLFLPDASSGQGAQVVSLAWPVRHAAAGQPLGRNPLPLGMTDFASQAYWQETYKGETNISDEWYCELPEEVWCLLEAHRQTLLAADGAPHTSSRLTLAPDCAAHSSSDQPPLQLLADSVQGSCSQPAALAGTAHGSSDQPPLAAPPAGCSDQPPLQLLPSSAPVSCGQPALAAPPDGGSDQPPLPPDGCCCVLVPGSGNSVLGVQLLARHWSNVLCVDYVQDVVALMSKAYPPSAHPGLTWLHADICSLGNHIQGDSVSLIADKATLDALCTTDAACQQRHAACDLATRYLEEMWRVVLKPTGRLLVISVKSPTSFGHVLSQARTTEGGVAWCVVDHVLMKDNETHAYMCCPSLEA